MHNSSKSFITEAFDFLVHKRDLHETTFSIRQDPDSVTLKTDEVLLRVDHFAFTSNNIGYAALGESLGYWNFFTAPEGWGRIPVWGFADIIRSNHAELFIGERLYGYLPMSTHLIVPVGNVSALEFTDGSPHRVGKAPVYNRYLRLAEDAVYNRANDGKFAVFRPLFTTGFLIDDFLAENDFFGAQSIILSSASSKTALGLAFMLSERPENRCKILGLTGYGNVSFVRMTGYYDQVLAYDALGDLPRDAPVVFIDFAGNGTIVREIHDHLGNCLRYSASVGNTHWNKGTSTKDLPGPAPEFFSAPARGRKRIGEWGGALFQTRTSDAMGRFLQSVAPWLRIIKRNGREEVQRAYSAVVGGKANPAEAYLLSLHPDA